MAGYYDGEGNWVEQSTPSYWDNFGSEAMAGPDPRSAPAPVSQFIEQPGTAYTGPQMQQGMPITRDYLLSMANPGQSYDGEGNVVGPNPQQILNADQAKQWLALMDQYGVNSLPELPPEVQAAAGVKNGGIFTESTSGGLGDLINKITSYDPVAKNLPETQMLIDSLNTDLNNPYGPEKGMLDVLGAGPIGQITSGGHSIGLDPNDPGDRTIGRTVGTIAALATGAGALGAGAGTGGVAPTGNLMATDIAAAGAPASTTSLGSGLTMGGGSLGLDSTLAGTTGATANAGVAGGAAGGTGLTAGTGATLGAGRLGSQALGDDATAAGTASNYLPGETGGIPNSTSGGYNWDQFLGDVFGGNNSGSFPWADLFSAGLGAYGQYASDQFNQELLNRSQRWDDLAYQTATQGTGATPYGDAIAKESMRRSSAQGYNESGNLLTDLAKSLDAGTNQRVATLGALASPNANVVNNLSNSPLAQTRNLSNVMNIATGQGGNPNLYQGLQSLMNNPSLA